MQNLIEALLNFSRISTKNLVFENTDLNVLLDEAKKDLSDMILVANATIYSTKLPTLRVVPFQIQQLFSNLINNAIKYRRPGVPPLIRVDYLKVPGRSHSEMTGSMLYHRLMFSDNGIGFEQQYAEKIFEWFQRLHGRKEYPGSGIGLAICRKIVRNHHGMIEANGTPGHGATFDIYLPDE
jgi:light-regulated signal transduction histidine kinase (bacteriophytochrome)